jgi:hypothetical protein
LTRLAGLVMRELEERLARIEAGNHESESRELALDRAAKDIGERLGIPVLKLYGSHTRLEIGALGQESESLEGVFQNLRHDQFESQPDPNLKLKLLERLRFTRNHNPKPAPARALLLGDQRVIVAHAFGSDVALRAWAIRAGVPPLLLEAFNDAAVILRLPADSTLIGLSARDDSGLDATGMQPEWLALGSLQRDQTSERDHAQT